MTNEDFDALIAMVSDGRIARTEFLLKMQISASAVSAIKLLHQLPTAVKRNVEIAHLLAIAEAKPAVPEPGAPKKRAIPEGFTWNECDSSFMGPNGETSIAFYRQWVTRASEFPKF